MELCDSSLKEEDDCQDEIHRVSSDAVYEILTRVTLADLLRQCQWVCKDWQKLIICNKQFQKKHLQNTPSMRPGCLIYNSMMHCVTFVPYVADHHEHDTSPFLGFLPDPAPNTMIDCASQFGSLLCCVYTPNSSGIQSHYICKPATREWRKIPNPDQTSLGRYNTGIAVTQSYPKLEFQVLRLWVSRRGYELHSEVFDSTNWAWKRKQCIKFNEFTALRQKEAIFLNGGFHWSTFSNYVFAYYVDQEKWTLLKFSDDMIGKDSNYFIMNCDGKLGVAFFNKEWMEIWILESYSATEPIWKRKFRNDMRWIYENNPNRDNMGYYDLYEPVGMWSSDTVVILSYGEIVWFNCDKDTQTIIPCRLSNVFSMFRPEFSYI